MSQKPTKKKISIKNSMIIRTVPVLLLIVAFILVMEIGYYYTNSKNQMERSMKNTSFLIRENFKDIISESEKMLSSLAENYTKEELKDNSVLLSNICESLGWTELNIEDTKNSDTESKTKSKGRYAFTLQNTNSGGNKQIMLQKQLDLTEDTESYIYCVFSTKIIENILDKVDCGKLGKIYLLDEQGNIVFKKENINQNNLEIEDNDEQIKVIYKEYQKMAVDGENGYESYKGEEGRKYVFYSPLEINHWTIIVEEDFGENCGWNIQIFLIRLVVILMILIVSSIFLYKSLDNVMKSITKCVERVIRLKTGDLSTAVDIDERFLETNELTTALDQLVQGMSTMISDIKEVLGSLAEGNLDVTTKNVYPGEFRQIEEAVEHIAYEFNDMLTQLSNAAYEVTKGSEQVSQSSLFLSDGSSEQMMMVQKSYSSINKIIENLTGIVRIKSENYDNEKMDENPIKMEKLTRAMERITNSSEQIQKIVKTIAGISSQTKMLSINASVEAARAGAAGKGFSVVVEEIRELASKSREATNDTKKLILNVINSVENGSDTVSDTVESVEQIAVLINEFRDLLIKISNNTENTAAISEESAAASEQLNEQANHLQDMVNRFTLKKERGTIS